MNAHTPGPWTIHRYDPEWVMVMSGGVAGQIIANVNSKSCPNAHSAPAFVVMPQDVNAALIAAAPDLLAALEKCERGLTRSVEIMRISNFGDDKLLAEVRAAIASARGVTA